MKLFLEKFICLFGLLLTPSPFIIFFLSKKEKKKKVRLNGITKTSQHPTCMEDSGIFFFPFKNISKYPPVSQSKRILQLSVQPLSEHKVEFLSSLLFGGWCIFVGEKGCRKNTVARLLKTRSTSTVERVE